MPKKIELKTKPNNVSVRSYISSIEDSTLQKNGRTLLKIFKAATGSTPKMWGDSIVGYGEYTYHRANGDEGTFMATGFSLRKSGPTLYIMPSYTDYSHLLNKLGPHKLGKSCLYLKHLDDVNKTVLVKLIKAGIKDLKKRYPVRNI